MMWHSYTKIKPVQIRWLTNLPSHWQKFRLKHIANINTETLGEKTDPNYEIKYIDIGNVSINGLEHAPEVLRFEKAPSRARRIIHDGDTSISTVRTYLQAIAFFESTPSNLIASTGFAVLSPKRGVVPKFLYFLVREPRFINDVTANSVGVSYPAINPTVLANLPVWLPSMAEQRAIVAFLEVETGRIDALIAKKRALIARLQEKRTALISHAVTKGIDETAVLKPSNTPWLGDIPAHWEVKKTKYLFRLSIEKAPPNNDLELLSLYTAIGVRPRKSLEQKGNKASTTDGYWVVKKGDIVVNKLLAWMGSIGRSDYDGVTSPAYDILRNWQPLDSKYYHYLFRSGLYLPEFRRRSRGIMDMRLRLYFDELGQIPLPYPSIEEQNAIVASLENVTKDIDKLIVKLQNTIEKLTEYRTAVISAAVTGKIDVRSHQIM